MKKLTPLLGFALIAILGGCELYLGESEGDNWSYCGSDGFYTCKGDNCTFASATCPAGGNPDQVANINAPASLILDAQTSDPSVVTAGVGTLVVRYHVTSTCGGPVQGALVYGTATPFNQFAIPPEVPTGADGWAELRFQRLSGFPVSPRQQLIAMFARARKPGQSILVGIAARRLFSIPVNLHG